MHVGPAKPFVVNLCFANINQHFFNQACVLRFFSLICYVYYENLFDCLRASFSGGFYYIETFQLIWIMNPLNLFFMVWAISDSNFRIYYKIACILIYFVCFVMLSLFILWRLYGSWLALAWAILIWQWKIN